jgi:hypothetical protein
MARCLKVFWFFETEIILSILHHEAGRNRESPKGLMFRNRIKLPEGVFLYVLITSATKAKYCQLPDLA